MSIDENTFETVAEALLQHWSDAIEAIDAENVDVELHAGVLTVEVEGVGVFVLNKHAPLRQMWLSSPVSGASHYDYDAGAAVWRSTRGSDDLATTFGAELEEAAGKAFTLDYPRER
ncbi:MAG TPA: iron donor protein CyaY [Candidatus Sulfotelmatobacter sp.]|nr:iron donor protein CyaY [Candidatus Sulfotelmatobacter sp.]